MPDTPPNADHLIEAARSIVARPQPAHRPGLRLLAWAALKSARGQTVRQRRLQTKPIQTDGQVV